MLKFGKLLIINFILFICLFFILDDFVYRAEQKKYPTWISSKKYSFNNPNVYGKEFEKYGRRNIISYGEQKTNKYKNNPIVVFGCSFAYGQNLNENQTFEYKLAKLIHRDVINQALMAGGIQYMYFLTQNDMLYKKIPYSDEVIYIMFSGHLRRLLVDFFVVHLNYFNLRYIVKDGNIVIQNYDRPFINFFKSLYLVKWIQHKYVYYSIRNEKNAEKYTELQLLYFNKARENLEKNWGTKVKFTIVLYDKCFYEKLLIKKLKENGFNVISAPEITNNKISGREYEIPKDGHPNEAAWDLLTPLIAKKLNYL